MQEQRRLSRLHDDERRLWKMRAPVGAPPPVADA
jgi:hypothetical protein